MVSSSEVMLEKTREGPKLDDATYAHTLVIKSTHEYCGGHPLVKQVVTLSFNS